MFRLGVVPAVCRAGGSFDFPLPSVAASQGSRTIWFWGFCKGRSVASLAGSPWFYGLLYPEAVRMQAGKSPLPFVVQAKTPIIVVQIS